MGSFNENSYYNVILWKKNNLKKYYPKNILSLQFEEEDFDYLLFLKFENMCPFYIPNIDTLITSLELIYNESESSFIILTQRKTPPLYTASEDEFVFSFSCKFKYFKNLTNNFNRDILSTDLLFMLLDQISTSKSEFQKILIRQMPLEDNAIVPIISCDVIIPHRGDNAYLSNVLYFLNQINDLTIHVGIDQQLTEDINQLKEDYPKVSFYNFHPDLVGPYVIRNRLIDFSENEMIFFQDSDDISSADRFEKITDYMKKNECELCGSHELRFDYYNRTIQAIRFPIDVISALKTGPWHSLLHPASTITRNAFYKCGKLSEERIFGNDTKFLLTSFFFLKNIKNMDEFFYIRKKHPGSLTTNPNTMLGSSIRRKLLHTWSNDFEQIKYGGLLFEDSSLKYQPSLINFKVTRI